MAIYCAKCGYTIGAEGKIKINEARGDYFFYPNVTLWDNFFALALYANLFHANETSWPRGTWVIAKESQIFSGESSVPGQ